MYVKNYHAKMKILANKLACADDNITEKDLPMRILNGLGSSYLDLVLIIAANKMSHIWWCLCFVINTWGQTWARSRC